MNHNCQLVIFSDRAYNAIIRETFEWEPVETGGILLGHVLDNGCWLVMEVLPPGYGEGREGDNVHHEYGYFEYNQRFVNYLATSVAEQYEIPLELLGLWHRHPGSMDVFSGTDDVTNSTFAQQNPHGVISGLVNVDPQLRITMYYLAHGENARFNRMAYQKVGVEVIPSEDIPEQYRRLRYYDGSEKALHPYAPHSNRGGQKSRYNGQVHVEHDSSITQDNDNQNDSAMPQFEKWRKKLQDIPVKKKSLVILLVAMICFLLSLIPLKKNLVELKEVIFPTHQQNLTNPVDVQPIDTLHTLFNENKTDSLHNK